MQCRFCTIFVILLTTAAQAQMSKPGVSGAAPDAVQELFGAVAKKDDLLSAEQAFKLALRVRDGNTVVATLTPAKGYYLYRDRISFDVVAPSTVSIAKLSLPAGEVEQDPNFGAVQVYHQPVDVVITLHQADAGAARIKLHAGYQGCNGLLGVCYPPIAKTIALDLPAASSPK